MRNALIFTFLALAVIFVIIALRRKHKRDNMKTPPASSAETETVVIDPTTGREILVSEFGENTINDDMGTAQMEKRVASVVQNTANKQGIAPTLLDYKVYDRTGTVIGIGKFNPLISSLGSLSRVSDTGGCLDSSGKYYAPPCATQVAADRYTDATGG